VRRQRTIARLTVENYAAVQQLADADPAGGRKRDGASPAFV